MDTGSVSGIERLFEDLRRDHNLEPHQGPDILVSNAGYGKRIPDILDIPVDEFDYTLNVNLRASFVLAKLSIPGMQKKGWGRIVFVSSIAAIGGGINGCHCELCTFSFPRAVCARSQPRETQTLVREACLLFLIRNSSSGIAELNHETRAAALLTPFTSY